MPSAPDLEDGAAGRCASGGLAGRSRVSLAAGAEADADAAADPFGAARRSPRHSGSASPTAPEPYVQPGFAPGHAARTSMARMATMGRMVRMVEDLSVGADDRDRGVPRGIYRVGADRSAPTARLAVRGADSYQGTSTPPVPSSGLFRDLGGASLRPPLPWWRSIVHRGEQWGPPQLRATNHHRPSLADRHHGRPAPRHRTRAGGCPPLVLSQHRLSVAGRCWPAIVLIRDPETSLRVSSCPAGVHA